MIDKLPGIIDALHSLCPGAIWTLRGNTIDWSDDNELPEPTEEELNQEIERLYQEWENKQYQRDRSNSYPSIEEQLDILYHGGLDAWKQEINKIKEMYPKPEEL